MAELAPRRANKGGWLKTALGILGGVLSGAAVMYLTPLLDDAVKPARPLANFSFEADPRGLQVRFENLSTGGQGWWDFGDGSALEPVLPDQHLVYHTFPHPGEFTVKLSLHNLLGDENERSVALKLDPSAVSQTPRIQSFQVLPLSQGNYAPATFRLVSQVQNAQLVVCDPGDGRPLEVVTDLAHGSEKVFTFEKPGSYVLKLAAINGELHDERAEILKVLETPADVVTAILTSTYQGVPVETRVREDGFHRVFDAAQKESTMSFDRPRAASRGGFIFKDVVLHDHDGKEIRLGDQSSLQLNADALGLPNVQGLELLMTADRRIVHLRGELVRPFGAGHNPDAQPCLNLPVQLIQQRLLPAQQKSDQATTTLPVPSGGVSSSGLLQVPPPPPGWVNTQRSLRLEVREGSQLVWQTDSNLSQQVLLTLRNRPCLLNATLAGDQVRLDLREDPHGGPTASK